MELQRSAQKILDDVIFFLAHIDDDTYGRELIILQNGTLGQHTRHLIEFFQALLWQVDQKHLTYDNRARNRLIETSTEAALTAIDNIRNHLPQLPLDKIIHLTSQVGNSKVKSTVARELLYNIEHTIHHLAIVRMGLQEAMPEIILPPSFGVAPSTLEFRSRRGALAG